MAKFKRLDDLYRFPGFVPRRTVTGIFGDPRAAVITLQRRRKKHSVEAVVVYCVVSMISDRDLLGIFPVATSASTWLIADVGSSVLSANP